MERVMVAPAAAPPELTGNLCWLLSRTSAALSAELTEALHDLGFPARTHQVLVAAAAGEYTQIELARLVGLDKTTMVSTVDELERLGLAERRPSPADRRARIVAVTPLGRRRLAEADAALERIREDVLSVLPPAQRRALIAALQTLAAERLR
jgi:DNA-binding MarR family transcriptional regulator